MHHTRSSRMSLKSGCAGGEISRETITETPNRSGPCHLHLVLAERGAVCVGDLKEETLKKRLTIKSQG